MSTQKSIIHYHLFQYIAQRADYLAKSNGMPAPQRASGAGRVGS